MSSGDVREIRRNAQTLIDGHRRLACNTAIHDADPVLRTEERVAFHDAKFWSIVANAVSLFPSKGSDATNVLNALLCRAHRQCLRARSYVAFSDDKADLGCLIRERAVTELSKAIEARRCT